MLTDVNYTQHMTPNPFTSEGAEEAQGTRENFIAEVVRSEPDSDDERFQTQYESDIDILYELSVLDRDYENVFELGLNVNAGSLNSKWMVLIGHLENIHGREAIADLGGLDDLAEFLEGRVYEFKEQDMTADEEFTWEEKNGDNTINYQDAFGGQDNEPNPMLLPVREVTDEDELADLGAESEGTVEEVEF